jgi:PAS domain S-box-containing protein
VTEKPSYRKVVAALEESEERYRVLVEGVRRYAIFMLGPTGIIMTWNRGIFELLGYSRDEVVGRSGSMVFNQKEQTAGAFNKELARAKRTGESIAVRLNVHKDGTELRVHETSSALFDSAGTLLGFAKVARAIDGETRASGGDGIELAKALARIEVEVEHRRRLEAELLTAVEQERERLGRDLHDDLAQQLAAIALMMETTAKSAALSDGPREKLSGIARLVAKALQEARNLARGLHPVTLTRQGLPAALAELATRVPQGVEFSWPTSPKLKLEKSVALHVYRIAEEALGNAIRHSEANKITIELRPISEQQALISITDNGRGFVREAQAQGMGLQNMRYRAGVIEGRLTISTSLRRGTRVECTLPLIKRRAEPPSETKEMKKGRGNGSKVY